MVNIRVRSPVEPGSKACGECPYFDDYYEACKVFGEIELWTEDGPLRLPACLARELPSPAAAREAVWDAIRAHALVASALPPDADDWTDEQCERLHDTHVCVDAALDAAEAQAETAERRIVDMLTLVNVQIAWVLGPNAPEPYYERARQTLDALRLASGVPSALDDDAERGRSHDETVSRRAVSNPDP